MKLLLFTPQGGAQLLSSDAQGARILWSSDNDQDFAEEFHDFLDPDEDLHDLTDYLVEQEALSDGEEIEWDEQYLEDVDEDNDH